MKRVSEKTRVLNTLRQRKRGLTAVELTERLQLTSSQRIYAYISALRKEGHPILGVITKAGTKYQYSAAS